MAPGHANRWLGWWLLLAGLASAAPGRPLIEGSLSGQCHYGLQSVDGLQWQMHNTCPLPVTDVDPSESGSSKTGEPVVAASVSDSAWTHPVLCVMAVNVTLGEQRHYCVYTDALFGGGHGTSLITAPQTAADTVGADALEDRPFYGGSRQRVFVPGPVAGANGTGPSYAVQQTPGKGLGAVARRKIRQGEILMLDFPALIVGKKFLEDTQPRLRRRVLRRAIAQLPAATQDKVFALSKSTGGEELDDILGTNTCSIKLGTNEMHLGLFPEVSRLNHACNPNAYYRFSPRTLTMEVVAYRDIQPGEEITISYAQITLSRTARREFLHDNYHFNCKCSLCRASNDEVTLSEDRRKDIRKLQSQLVEATQEGDYLTALTAAEGLINTTDAEGLTWLMPEMYDILAAIYLDMKDFSNARRFGHMSLEGWERFDSVDQFQLESAHWFLRHVEDQKRLQA